MLKIKAAPLLFSPEVLFYSEPCIRFNNKVFIATMFFSFIWTKKSFRLYFSQKCAIRLADSF